MDKDVTLTHAISAFAKSAQFSLQILFAACLVASSHASIARAGTNCVNGVCYTCDGTLSCTNGACTCNGAPIEGSDPSGVNGPCGETPVAAHSNGGGLVAKTASVEPGVYVSSSSVVCGNAAITGPVRLLNSTISENSRVSGQSLIENCVIGGNSTVSDSSITNSQLSGDVHVSGSTVTNSSLEDAATAENAKVRNSILSGTAKVTNRSIEAAIVSE
jgi:hypothetical protein